MTNIPAAASAQPVRTPKNFKKRVLTWDEACAMWAQRDYADGPVADVGQYGGRTLRLVRVAASGSFTVRVMEDHVTVAEFYLGTDGLRDVWQIPLRRRRHGAILPVGSRIVQGFTPATSEQVACGMRSIGHRDRTLCLVGKDGAFGRGPAIQYLFPGAGTPWPVVRERFAMQMSDMETRLPADTSAYRKSLARECARLSLAAVDEVAELSATFGHTRATAHAERVVDKTSYRRIVDLFGLPALIYQADPMFSAAIALHVPEVSGPVSRMIVLRVIAHGRRLASLRRPCFVLSTDSNSNPFQKNLRWRNGDSLGAWLLAHTDDERDIIGSSMTLDPMLDLMREWCAAGVVIPA